MKDIGEDLLKERNWHIAAALILGLLLCAVVVLFYGPMPQPQSYHQFADQRTVLGIPHAGDVLTNLAFIVVGALGMWFLFHQHLSSHCFIDRREQWSFLCLFIGIFLTGFGSGWYHLEPDNYSLVWDRLPMALAFMAIFSVMLSERIKLSLGVIFLWPLVIIGVSSVLWWIWTEHEGNGDLRWYLMVQFYPLITVPLMLILLSTPYTRGNDYWGMFMFYASAKIVEVLDHDIFNFTDGFISGHSLKHLFAAAGAAWLLRMLWLRQPQHTSRHQSDTLLMKCT